MKALRLAMVICSCTSFAGVAAKPLFAACESGTEPECHCQFPDQLPRFIGDAGVFSDDSTLFFVPARIADSFSIAEDSDCLSIRWWGAYMDQFTFVDCVAPDHVFDIRLYDDLNGFPNNELMFETVSTATGLQVVDTGLQILVLGTLLNEQSYAIDLDLPPTLIGGEVYWLEIIGRGTGDDCAFAWETGPPGDVLSMIDANIDGYDPSDIADVDMSWCIELADTDVLTLGSVEPGLVGQNNTLSITGATPGEEIFLYYSESLGTAAWASCGINSDLDSPILLGQLIADVNGEATFNKFINTSASGRTFHVQAAERDTCTISNVSTITFP